MGIDQMTRRESLRRLFQLFCGLTASVPAQGAFKVLAATEKQPFLVEALGRTEGYSVKDLTKKMFESAGGINRFVSRGDVVVIKPNLSWSARPELAATTNPHVLEAVVEICAEAGASKIRIADNTIHDPRQCFALSGAGMVAKKTGAELVMPRSSLMKKMKIKGRRLDLWPVFVPLVEADKVINLPIAKHHSLSSLTLGMKNWIGGIGGRRWALHQDIHQSIVDLARFFRPTVTLIDAIRILTRNGPSGGSPDDVAARNTLILSDDQVAADAAASRLFQLDPEKLWFLKLGHKQGLGTYDQKRLVFKRVTL
jgi:uncharacterized protein (DUF362 family)